MQAPQQPADLVARALAYPYAVAPGSFLLAGTSAEDARDLDPTDADLASRSPLLAYGSNAAPEILAGKLGRSAVEHPVPALRAALRDFDVVYSAHISRYGSIPAALQRSPGTEAAVFVLYLTEEQLALVSSSEPNYELVTLRGLLCRLEGGEVLTETPAYMSRHGCLLLDGSEVALAAVEAKGRRFPAMTQAEVLERVREMLSPEDSIETFIASGATDPELAHRRTEALRRSGGR